MSWYPKGCVKAKYVAPWLGSVSKRCLNDHRNEAADLYVVVPAADLNGVAAEYRYLRPSIERYPKGAELVELACEAGFQSAVFYELAPGNLMGCLVCER